MDYIGSNQMMQMVKENPDLCDALQELLISHLSKLRESETAIFTMFSRDRVIAEEIVYLFSLDISNVLKIPLEVGNVYSKLKYNNANYLKFKELFYEDEDLTQLINDAVTALLNMDSKNAIQPLLYTLNVISRCK